MAERLCVRRQIGEGEFNSHSGLVKREDREDVTMVVRNLHQGGRTDTDGSGKGSAGLDSSLLLLLQKDLVPLPLVEKPVADPFRSAIRWFFPGSRGCSRGLPGASHLCAGVQARVTTPVLVNGQRSGPVDKKSYNCELQPENVICHA